LTPTSNVSGSGASAARASALRTPSLRAPINGHITGAGRFYPRLLPRSSGSRILLLRGTAHPPHTSN
jgi:hypothetical protein